MCVVGLSASLLFSLARHRKAHLTWWNGSDDRPAWDPQLEYKEFKSMNIVSGMLKKIA